MHNDKYDEAIDVSQSVEQSSNRAPGKGNGVNIGRNDDKLSQSKAIQGGGLGTRSQTVQNQKFDEAYEVSHSGSDDSVDASGDNHKFGKPAAAPVNGPRVNAPMQNMKPAAPVASVTSQSSIAQWNEPQKQPIPANQGQKQVPLCILCVCR